MRNANAMKFQVFIFFTVFNYIHTKLFFILLFNHLKLLLFLLSPNIVPIPDVVIDNNNIECPICGEIKETIMREFDSFIICSDCFLISGMYI